MQVEQPSKHLNPSQRALDMVALAILTILAILINGYQFANVNHDVHIPFMLKAAYPSLFPNDLMFSFPFNNTLFYVLLAPLVKRINLEYLFFGGYTLATFFYFWAVFCLGKLIFKSRAVAYFCVILLLKYKSSIAFDYTYYDIFYYNNLVMPGLLLAIYLFLKERYVWSFAITGLAFDIHALSASHVMAMFLFYFAFNRGDVSIKQVGKYMIAFLICASPLLFWKLLGGGSSIFYTSTNWSEWLTIMKIRNGHHLFPSTWKIKEWEPTLLYIALLFCLIKYKPEPKYHKKLMAFCWAILALCVTGTIFAEIAPLKPVLMFQLLRSANFFIIFSILYASNCIMSLILSPEKGSKVIAAALATALFFWGANINSLSVAIFILSLAWTARFTCERGALRKELKISWIFLSIVCLCTIGANAGTNHIDFPPKKLNEWQQLQVWVKNHTDPADVFITPPYMKGFRIFSERSTVGDWKDGTLAFYNDELGAKWWAIMKELGYSESKYGYKYKAGFDALTPADFKRLASQYRATYLVVIKPKNLEFNIVYESPQFLVYRLS